MLRETSYTHHWGEGIGDCSDGSGSASQQIDKLTGNATLSADRLV